LRYVSSIAWAGLAAVSIALIYAFVSGHLATDLPRLVDNPLGLATLVDVYVGFALFSCWIVWRESRLTTALIWIAMIMVGGNIVSTMYVLVALRSSNGTVEVFWLGSRYRDSKMQKVLE
jgi:hypothetical protein